MTTDSNAGQDSQWMRDVFDTTRGEEEPAWFPDAQALIGGGDRRRRLRTVGAGSGSLAALAAVAIVVSVAAPDDGGRSTTAPPTAAATAPSKAQATAPSTAQPTRPQGTIFDRVNFMPLQLKNMGSGDPRQTINYVPEPTVSDMAAVLAALDPTSSHFVPTPNTQTTTKAVPLGDKNGDNVASLQVNSAWTPDGKPAAQDATHLATSPNGNLLTRFLDGDDAKFQPSAPGCGAADSLGEAWSNLNPGHGDGADQVAWGACDHRQLGDGSTLASTTKSFGPFTAVFATRQFPAGAGTVETLWINYSIRDTPSGITPNPDTVLSPSPLTAQKLTAVLSGNEITPGLKTAVTVAVPPTLLQAADFGTDWKLDPTSTASRPIDLVNDACAGSQSGLLGDKVPDYVFAGPTPSGLNVRADVLRLAAKAGTGAQKLADLRTQAETKCGTTTVTALPTGIGDGGFIENIPGLPTKSWNIFIRFGDTLIEVNINSPENSPSFTQSDKQWLTNLATKAATRFSTSH